MPKIVYFMMVLGRKHIFLNVTPWFIFTFWHVPWIAYEYWRGFKSPSAAAVQACFTRCTVSHVQQKRFIMKSIFSRYPCFVINDNNYLCLYTSDTVSRQRCIFCCTSLQMNKISKKDPHLFQNPLMSFYPLFQSNVTRWLDKKEPPKICLLTLTLHNLIPLIAIFLFAEPLWSLTLVGSYTQE